MDLKSELLKSIWYAFTSLEAEHSGKVSKSQLKVLSHNLYTALNIPHDALALEEHFQDNDNGPVSSNGYMPYLNQYILAKATEGTFNKETFDDLCWMMTAKKNLKPSVSQGLCSQRDCFKLFCLFNLLSEDYYPLVIILPELEYLLKKMSTAMGQEWDGKLLECLLTKEPYLQDGLSVWTFLEQLSAGQLMRVDSKEAFSLALDEIFMEMYQNVLKKGYMQKKGHVRRNWQERWFMLKPGIMVYYVNEDQKEKKGELQLDGSCTVEIIPDKEGKRCLFCVKTPGRTYEMSASDLKLRLEWMQAIQTALRLQAEGKSSLHQELKLRRRELRKCSESSSQKGTSRQNSQNGSQSEQRVSQSEQSSSQSAQSEQGSSQSAQSEQSGSQSEQRGSLSAQSQQSSSQGVQSQQSIQSEPPAETEQPGSDTHEELEINEPDLEIINIIQEHLEKEMQHRVEEAQQQEMLKERHQELERQLKEANTAREGMAAELAKMEKELQQQKKRIQELELTQQKLEEVLNLQIQSRLEEEKARHELERQLEEEQKKLNDLLHLQKNLETSAPAEKSQNELRKFQKDEELKPHSLFSSSSSSTSSLPHSQPSKPQPTTHLTHPSTGTAETYLYNLEEMSDKHSKAKYMRQWNVQLNRLMKPITPADKIERMPVKTNCPKRGQALTSTEFITKYQSTSTQETELSDSQTPNREEEVYAQESLTVSEEEVEE
ncbi:differentially expressed in FDCP 6 homolog [Hoplias malabaricus]|uniref:differentially expressed in FDCP 6 homolog n=1 Tax=Hoplias malabaricus TaxID=27720 RepID=UPI0034626879